MDAVRQYRESGGDRDLAMVVGEVGATRFRTYIWAQTRSAIGVLTGLSMISWGLAVRQPLLWRVAILISAASGAAYLLSVLPIARTLATTLGKPIWWCADQCPTSIARFVTWVDGQLVASGAPSRLPTDVDRDAALALLDRRRAGRAQPRTLKTRAISLLVLSPLAFVVLGLKWEHRFHPAGATTGIPAAPTIPYVPQSSPPSAVRSHMPAGPLTCAKLVRIPSVEGSFGYVPGATPTLQHIRGIVLPGAPRLVACAINQSADPAVGNTRTIVYAFANIRKSAYAHRLIESGWADSGDGTYTYFPAHRSLQVELFQVGPDLVVVTDDSTP